MKLSDAGVMDQRRSVSSAIMRSAIAIGSILKLPSAILAFRAAMRPASPGGAAARSRAVLRTDAVSAATGAGMLARSGTSLPADRSMRGAGDVPPVMESIMTCLLAPVVATARHGLMPLTTIHQECLIPPIQVRSLRSQNDATIGLDTGKTPPAVLSLHP